MHVLLRLKMNGVQSGTAQLGRWHGNGRRCDPSLRQPNTPSPQTVTEGTCVASVCSKGYCCGRDGSVDS